MVELDGAHPLQLLGRTLCARLPQDAALLRNAIDQASTQGLRRLLTLGEGEHQTSVSIVPLELAGPAAGAVLVVLGKSAVCESLSMEGYARAHGLTCAETRVLVELSRGAKPADIACGLGVAISTIRTQIGSVRTKTGTPSIRALLRQLSVLPPHENASGLRLLASRISRMMRLRWRCTGSGRRLVVASNVLLILALGGWRDPRRSKYGASVKVSRPFGSLKAIALNRDDVWPATAAKGSAANHRPALSLGSTSPRGVMGQSANAGPGISVGGHEHLDDAFGKRIRCPSDLGLRLSSDPETVSRFERGATLPSLVRLLDLAEALDVTFASLIGGASPRGTDEFAELTQMVSNLPPKDRKLVTAVVTAIVDNRKS
jgi:DNA-binding CsgD family transcriptional regulator/transcriptional regulator with XRE-family HTH domain